MQEFRDPYIFAKYNAREYFAWFATLTHSTVHERQENRMFVDIDHNPIIKHNFFSAKDYDLIVPFLYISKQKEIQLKTNFLFPSNRINLSQRHSWDKIDTSADFDCTESFYLFQKDLQTRDLTRGWQRENVSTLKYIVFWMKILMGQKCVPDLRRNLKSILIVFMREFGSESRYITRYWKKNLCDERLVVCGH